MLWNVYQCCVISHTLWEEPYCFTTFGGSKLFQFHVFLSFENPRNIVWRPKSLNKFFFCHVGFWTIRQERLNESCLWEAPYGSTFKGGWRWWYAPLPIFSIHVIFAFKDIIIIFWTKTSVKKLFSLQWLHLS